MTYFKCKKMQNKKQYVQYGGGGVHASEYIRSLEEMLPMLISGWGSLRPFFFSSSSLDSSAFSNLYLATSI